MKKYEQVVRTIEDGVRLETLRDGERLPSVRSLARQMGVSILTVLNGYRRLESQGLIESRPRSGYYVRPRPLCDRMVRPPEAGQPEIELRSQAVTIPDAVERFLTHTLRKDVVTLGSELSEPDFFPNEELSIRLARIVRTYARAVNECHVDRGCGELLDVIARLMMDCGCTVNEEEIVVTPGVTQALMLALRALTRPGETVAVESPGYNGFYGLLMFLNLKAVEIPSHPQTGLSVDALDSVLTGGLRPACVLLSANYSNPTGALMPDENKEKLARLCRRHNLPVIEDDTMGELAFGPQRPRPLKAWAPHLVIYVGGFTKVLSPGYRLAWLAGGAHTADIRRCFGLSVFATPVATQLTLASFVRDGGMKRHLRRFRRQCEENVRLFQAKIARSFPLGTRTSNPRGGKFLWVELPEGYDAVALSVAAIDNRISIAPGPLFSSRQHYRENFRLNCGLKWSPEVEKAIERLGELCQARINPS